MINLIRRDIILQKWQLLIFIPFVAFFIIMDSHPILTFLVASVFIPFNAFAYDEKAHTHMLLNSLPYTRKEIITSRYLGAVFYMVIAIGVTCLGLFISSTPYTITDIAVASGLFLLFAAFTFPLFYILKPGYIYYVALVIFLSSAAIGPPIVIFLLDNLTAISTFIYNLSTPLIFAGSFIIVMSLYVLSWWSTAFVYQRKTF